MEWALNYQDQVNQQVIGGYTPLMIVSMHDSREPLDSNLRATHMALA
jgi:hypothetical protein